MKISQNNCISYQCIQKKLQFGAVYGGIIEPYFFKDAANRNVTVSGERYREMISNFIFAQNVRAWLVWHVVSTKRCHMPHNTLNGLIERRVRWTFYFTLFYDYIYMHLTIDSNKDLIHFSEFYLCFLKNFSIALKKSPFVI